MKKETSAVWYKDGHEIKSEQNLGFTEGVLKLEIAQVGINLSEEICNLYNIINSFLLILVKICGTLTFYGHLAVLVTKREYINRKQKKAKKVVDILLTKSLNKAKLCFKP